MHDPIVPAMTENVPKDITMTSETEETVLAEALAMTGLKTPAELIDMANVGQSLMERIADLIKQDGPFKGWMPADDPAEIVFDLVNHYEDAALSRAPEAGREGAAERLAIVAEKPARLIRWGEGDRLDLQSVLAALSPPSTGGEGEAVETLADLAALVRGECPRLLNEDSGGNAELSLRIDAILSKLKENGLSREELGGSARASRGAAGPSDCAVGDAPRSDEWQDIESTTPPHDTAVLLGWQDSRGGCWISEVAAYSTGERFDNGYSNLSLHGSATHWMSLPPPPPQNSDGGRG